MGKVSINQTRLEGPKFKNLQTSRVSAPLEMEPTPSEQTIGTVCKFLNKFIKKNLLGPVDISLNS